MYDPQRIRFQQEQQSFSPFASPGIVMESLQRRHADSRSKRKHTLPVHSHFQSFQCVDSVMIMMAVRDQCCVRLHFSYRISAAFSIGICHDAHTVFRFHQEFRMANVLNDHVFRPSPK